MLENVYVVEALRTAVGKAKRGALVRVRPDDMAAAVIKALVERTGVKPEEIEDVTLGCAFPEGEQGMNMARVALLAAGLPDTVPGMTINRFCSSGLESMSITAAKIQAGLLNLAVAGGAESMSMIPMGGLKPAPNPGLTVNHPQIYTPMGVCGDNVAREFHISREECDRWALRSNQRAAAAVAEGRFKEEIVPLEVPQPDGSVVVFDTDEGPRGDSTLEGLGALRPAFNASPKNACCTAGNSSQMSDGAAAALFASEAALKAHGLKAIARFRGYNIQAGDPSYLGPPQVHAVNNACAQAGITPKDLGLVECNEAFATQTLLVIRELGLDPEIVNVNGSAIALGHPLGCTGAKLTATLLHEMKRRKVKWGCVTMCIGGGMGGAGVFELIDA